MGYSMRLEHTLVHSWMFFSWFRLWVYIEVISPPLPLECVYFSLLYPSLIFDMFLLLLLLCVCMLEWFWISLTVIFLLCVWVTGCLGDFLCVGLCVFKFTFNSFHFLSVYICIYISMYIYICVCVCVCVCFRLNAFVWEHVWYKV